MLTVKQAAEKLGVSGTRIRAMIYDGILEAEKFGTSWGVSEDSLERRLQTKRLAGRPRKNSRQAVDRGLLPKRNIVTARRLYRDCEKYLTGCYNADFLSFAKDEREERFYIHISDFFLREKQKELIEQKVF